MSSPFVNGSVTFSHSRSFSSEGFAFCAMASAVFRRKFKRVWGLALGKRGPFRRIAALTAVCGPGEVRGPLFCGNPVCNLIFRDNEIVLTGKRKISKTTGSFSFGAARDVFITGNHYRVAPSVGAFEPFVKGDVPGLTVDGNVIDTKN